MTDVQKKLMELMDELDQICKQEGLHYILFGSTLASARKAQGFVQDEYDFFVQMPLCDAIKFYEYVKKQNNEHREMESWKENASLDQFVFRYVNSDTLLIDELSGKEFKKPGVAVTIYVSRTEKLSAKESGCERYLMLVNSNGKQKLPSAGQYLKTKVMKKLRMKGKPAKELEVISDLLNSQEGLYYGLKKGQKLGKEGLADWVLDCYKKATQTVEGTQWFLSKKGQWKKLPAGIYDRPKQTLFEGKSFPAPEKEEDFFQALYGKNWLKTVEKSPYSAAENFIIAECDLPYADYLEATKNDSISMSEILEERRDYRNWKRKYYIPAEKKVSAAFRLVRCSQERIDLCVALEEKQEELKEAVEQKDVASLKSILEDYLRRTDAYYNDQVGFYIDDMIFAGAKLVWEASGKQGYAEKVYALVPEKWKKKDLHKHIKGYRK